MGEGNIFQFSTDFDIHSSISLLLTSTAQSLGPLAAALLNSTFVQAFELDDYHSEAPIHSNSVLLPALFAAVQSTSKSSGGAVFNGASFLLATIVGYEVGPRVGLGLYGTEILSRGWHSGAVFGPSASAAAVSKLLELSPNAIEDAVGIACTQACGLMSAQYESDVKRMQHGFAARNGLFAALMARGGYIGIKQVLERHYGGFLSTFGQGSGNTPPYREEEITKELGEVWQMDSIRVKPYASMAGTHCTIDCIKELQVMHQELLADSALKNIDSITVEMADVAFMKGGWVATRPLTATGAQMSAAYAASVQLVDRQVLPAQFSQQSLDRDAVWDLIQKTECKSAEEFKNSWAQRVTIKLKQNTNQPDLVQTVKAPKGVDPVLSNEEIFQKWRLYTDGVIDVNRRNVIERLVLGLENLTDISELISSLWQRTNGSID